MRKDLCSSICADLGTEVMTYLNQSPLEGSLRASTEDLGSLDVDAKK